MAQETSRRIQGVMKLYIDTSDAKEIVIGIDKKRFKSKAKKDKSQKLLPFIVDTLKKEKTSIKEITEIKVNPGPGSFTGLRVGVAVANALGYVLGVPVNGREPGKEKGVDIKYE